MPEQNRAEQNWYKSVQYYTQRLVSIRSVSPGEEELRVAQEVLHLLCEGDMKDKYTSCGLDPLEGDTYGRQNAYAFLHGQSTSTLILLGHIDTVDTKDYGPLEPMALHPEGLTTKRDILGPVLEGTAVDDWMFGRGVGDMKSGVAVNIALIRHFAEAVHTSRSPLSIVFLATPDEENESAGVLQAVHFLSRLREQYGLEYIGAINTDYTTARYAGDPHRYVYSGTIGKLLPSFLCIGRESHVGAPFDGVDANLLASELIQNLSMNDELCDIVHRQITAPPVTLRSTDLKAHYDVQLPFAAYFYLNVLTFTTTSETLLERLHHYAQKALKEVLERIDTTEERWRQVSGEQSSTKHIQPRSGTVLTYADLYAQTVQRLGKMHVIAALSAEWEHWPAMLDKRERSLHLVYKLWTLSGRQGPAVIIYYSPPYYPHVAATQGALQEAVTAVVNAHPELKLVQQEYFPYLCDMSYLRLDPGTNISALKANMPVWREPSAASPPGSYYLPLEAIEKLNIPVVNFGPYGQGVHQRNEGVLMSYSFGILPQLLYETIDHLATAQT